MLHKQQLPLAIQLPDAATFDAYIAGDNSLLLQLLQAQSELQLYCWSPLVLGKTHLLQASCRLASGQGKQACYLPMMDLVDYGPAVLDGLESLDLVCVDDIDCIAGDAAWERAVFDLINRCRAQAVQLVFAAKSNINETAWGLADLVSRLSWGPLFQLKALSDEHKIQVLQQRAQMRGIALPVEVGNYLLRRFPRDMRSLCQQFDKLDQASLAAQRRLTVPFVKQVLDN